MIFWPTLESKLIIAEANSADQNEVIVRCLLQRAVSSNIAALITQRNKPALKITAGRVKILMSDPKKVLMIEKRRATQR